MSTLKFWSIISFKKKKRLFFFQSQTQMSSKFIAHSMHFDTAVEKVWIQMYLINITRVYLHAYTRYILHIVYWTDSHEFRCFYLA